MNSRVCEVNQPYSKLQGSSVLTNLRYSARASPSRKQYIDYQGKVYFAKYAFKTFNGVSGGHFGAPEIRPSRFTHTHPHYRPVSVSTHLRTSMALAVTRTL